MGMAMDRWLDEVVSLNIARGDASKTMQSDTNPSFTDGTVFDEGVDLLVWSQD